MVQLARSRRLYDGTLDRWPGVKQFRARWLEARVVDGDEARIDLDGENSPAACQHGSTSCTAASPFVVCRALSALPGTPPPTAPYGCACERTGDALWSVKRGLHRRSRHRLCRRSLRHLSATGRSMPERPVSVPRGWRRALTSAPSSSYNFTHPTPPMGGVAPLRHLRRPRRAAKEAMMSQPVETTSSRTRAIAALALLTPVVVPPRRSRSTSSSTPKSSSIGAPRVRHARLR